MNTEFKHKTVRANIQSGTKVLPCHERMITVHYTQLQKKSEFKM